MSERKARPPAERINGKFAPGVSGNPSGRASIGPKAPEVVTANASKGAERMRQLLEDDSGWGPKGWMDAKTQVKLAETAITKAYGQSLTDPKIRALEEQPGDDVGIGTVLFAATVRENIAAAAPAVGNADVEAAARLESFKDGLWSGLPRYPAEPGQLTHRLATEVLKELRHTLWSDQLSLRPRLCRVIRCRGTCHAPYHRFGVAQGTQDLEPLGSAVTEACQLIDQNKIDVFTRL